jgi:hypothetical protein
LPRRVYEPDIIKRLGGRFLNCHSENRGIFFHFIKRPYGTQSADLSPPTPEVVGYCQASLRDAHCITLFDLKWWAIVKRPSGTLIASGFSICSGGLLPDVPMEEFAFPIAPPCIPTHNNRFDLPCPLDSAGVPDKEGLTRYVPVAGNTSP